MEIITLLLLFVLGIVLLLVEIFLIPGLSIAGIGCFISLAACSYLSFKFFGTLVGIITLIIIVVVVPLLIYFIFKSKAVKPMMLETNIDGKMKNVEDDAIHTGDEGVTIGRLAPSGKAKINGITLEVRTTGTFVDPHTKIKVLKVEGNTVIIEPINE